MAIGVLAPDADDEEPEMAGATTVTTEAATTTVDTEDAPAPEVDLAGIEVSDDSDGRLYLSSDAGLVLPLGEDECVTGGFDPLTFDVQVFNEDSRQVDTSSPHNPEWLGGGCLTKFSLTILVERLSETLIVQVGREEGAPTWEYAVAELFAGQGTPELDPVIWMDGTDQSATIDETDPELEFTDEQQALIIRLAGAEVVPTLEFVDDAAILEMADAICEMSRESSDLSDLGLNLLVLWSALDADTQAAFGGESDNLASFAGGAASIRCPDEFERITAEG